MRLAAFAFGATVLSFMTGCSEDGAEKQPPARRPVLSIVVQPATEHQIGFAGTIQPRYQTDRGFQVLGRIVARHVDVGDLVKAGQKLAENDPLVYQLAVRSGEAELARARSELDRAAAKRERTASLVAQRISSQADLDSADQARDAAAASVRQAEASLVKSREELRYTTLIADADGVVTSVDAQVGQMASAGTKVMTIARTDVREAVVDLPEGVARALSAGSPFEIALQADATIRVGGEVREIAPQADAATRTRRVRITLDRSADPFRLGSTIYARALAAAGSSAIEIPATSILERDGATLVWVVDPASRSVRAIAVEVAERLDGDVRIAKGLEVGARVVVAGVHSLVDGQAVAFDEGAVK
ncbi:efflux RND transporter periplasmic adaptor subunit [Hansschlegelia sp. KR7-227]|uniref:efflux RND transporter periplasmic adaptor subunit n=1 Tax=Hansschlegelia sp. KR7-227 TaxID=3400914 RepID=UPI003C0EB2CD